MFVTDKHPSRSGIRMHELCIAWSLIVRAETPWRCKIVISRPVQFARSFSRSVNFFSTSWYRYSVREVEVTVLSPIVCGNWRSEGHILAMRACALHIEGFWMMVSCCAGLHGTAIGSGYTCIYTVCFQFFIFLSFLNSSTLYCGIIVCHSYHIVAYCLKLSELQQPRSCFSK